MERVGFAAGNPSTTPTPLLLLCCVMDPWTSCECSHSCKWYKCILWLLGVFHRTHMQDCAILVEPHSHSKTCEAHLFPHESMGKVCLQISKFLPALIVFEFPLIGTSQGQTAGEWQSWGAPSPRLSAQGSSRGFPGSLGSNGLVLQDFLSSLCRGQRVHNELKSLSQLSPQGREGTEQTEEVPVLRNRYRVISSTGPWSRSPSLSTEKSVQGRWG